MHIGILQCDSVSSSLQTVYGDYPDMHRRLLTSNAMHFELKFYIYDLTASQFPDTSSECDAWLITGSRWSVLDNDLWIAHALQFVQQLHAERRPLVGICFGHQLISQALGGKIGKADVGWGVGVHTIDILERKRWMEPYREKISLLVSHQDQVIKPPTEAMLLASHPFCHYDMLAIDDHILTLQGHPEFPRGYARALMDKRRDRIGESTYNEGVASLEKPTDADVVGGWILRFLGDALGKAQAPNY